MQSYGVLPRVQYFGFVGGRVIWSALGWVDLLHGVWVEVVCACEVV